MDQAEVEQSRRVCLLPILLSSFCFLSSFSTVGMKLGVIIGIAIHDAEFQNELAFFRSEPSCHVHGPMYISSATHFSHSAAGFS